MTAPRKKKKSKANDLPRSYVEGRKRAWRNKVPSGALKFLGELLQTADLHAAWRACDPVRAKAPHDDAVRGVNQLLSELNLQAPGLWQSVIAEANRNARQKTDMALNAALDAEDPEARDKAVATNLKRFTGVELEPSGAGIVDPRPIVAEADHRTIEQRFKDLFSE